MSYKVSILVPVYEVEQYIERCIRSLFEQDYENIEYIFVDDCSPDRSIEVLQKTLCDYPNRKDQVRIIRHEKNRGLGAARNTAVKNASGLFLIHCDSDDWMDVRAVSWLVERQMVTDADIVSGKSCLVFDCNYEERLEPRSENREELLFQMLSVNDISSYAIWKRLIRASLYHDYHIEVREGVNMCEDLQVTPQLVYYSKQVAWIDQIIYFYNQNNQSSYCKQVGNNNCLLEQKMTSYEILREFFSDKEKGLYTAASEKTIYGYWLCVHDAAKYHNRAFFEKCKAAINGKYAEYQYVLGYENPLKKWFEQQYWIYGPFLRTRSFVYNQVKRVLKLNENR